MVPDYCSVLAPTPGCTSKGYWNHIFNPQIRRYTFLKSLVLTFVVEKKKKKILTYQIS